MRGDHVRRKEPAHGRHEPEPERRHAILIDVAGEEEVEGTALDRMMLENPNAVRKTALRLPPP